MQTLVHGINPVHTASYGQAFLKSRHYRAIKYIQENEVLNRGILDLGSGFLPVFIVELFGRNWQSAVETLFGNGLRLLTNFISPLLLVPLWNKISAARNNLPIALKGLFKVQFEDLIPEVSLETFRQKLTETGCGDPDSISKLSLTELKSLKKKLLDAKTFVRKLDLLSVGFLTYVSSWMRNWFTRKVLGVVGHVGELGLLSESQRRQSSGFYEKFKFLLFGVGLIPLFVGSIWDANKLRQAVSVSKSEAEKDIVLNHMRSNMGSLDYYDGYITKRGNLLRHNVYGGIASRLLASRSVNEFIERLVRLTVSLLGNFWGDLIAHKALAKRSDKQYGTEIISSEKVKALSQLEVELNEAVKRKDKKAANKFLKSIKGQIKTYYQSMSLNAFVMAVVTIFSIWNTTRRVRKGAY